MKSEHRSDFFVLLKNNQYICKANKRLFKMIEVFFGCIFAITAFIMICFILIEHFMNKAIDDFYDECGRYPTPEETNMIFQLMITNIFIRKNNYDN